MVTEQGLWQTDRSYSLLEKNGQALTQPQLVWWFKPRLSTCGRKTQFKPCFHQFHCSTGLPAQKDAFSVTQAAHCLNLDCSQEASSPRLAYSSREQSRDDRSLRVRQHYSSSVQHSQFRDYCTAFVSLNSQIINKSRMAPIMHTIKHNCLSEGDVASSFCF